MIEHSALTTKVYEWLREGILRHNYRPGDKLDIQQLADQLGVSRTPVKDAINRLAMEGLVVLHSRQGTYVATLNDVLIRELFEVREMVEAWVAGRLTRETLLAYAAQFSDFLARSEQLLTDVDAARFDADAFIMLDRQIHSLLVDLDDNAVLSESYQRVIARGWIGRIYFVDEEELLQRSRASHAEHRPIIAAIIAGDGEALARALRVHTQASLAHTLAILARVPQQLQERQSRRFPGVGRAEESA